MRRLLACSLFALFSFNVAAKSGAHTNIDIAKFQEQRDFVEGELNKGELYREIGIEQKREVLRQLELMASLLSRHGSVDAMPEDERVRLFNAQETVNTLLTTAAEDSRLICRREVATGSHRQITNCKTVAERRQAREQGQDAMRTMQKGAMPLERGG